MTGRHEQAAEPADLTRLFVKHANEGDAEKLAGLYEPDAVLEFPPGKETRGRDAIKAIYEQALTKISHFEEEKALPTIRVGNLALTSTYSADEKGVRVQVVRQQADGTWLRVIDRPEAPPDAR